MRRRVCGGQIMPERSEIRFWTGRTKPMVRIRHCSGDPPLASVSNARLLEGEAVHAGQQRFFSSGRNRAIGTHFPTVVALAVAEHVMAARRRAVRPRPVLPAAFPRASAWQARARLAVFPTLGTNVGKRVTRSSRRGSRVSARSAGLGSVTTQLSTAQPPGCHIAQLGCWICTGEIELGMGGAPSFDLGFEKEYRTTPSRMTS
jgi:hypothetical protein